MYNKLKSFFIGEFLDQTDGFHDRSRITLLFNIASAVMFMGVTATLISLIFRAYPILVPGLGNLLFALIALYFLKKKKLQTAALVYFSVLFLLLFGNLNFNDGTMHVGSPFWVMLLNILVLYILGLRWGIIFLTLSLFGFLYYLHFVYSGTLEIVAELPKAAYYSAYYETFFALFLLAYIIATILRSSKESDELLKEQNAALTVQNQMIKASDEEKTVMLKEIHHRVKNNLQVIISLLRLQMKELTEPEAISKFRDSINRVLTMAAIHEKIYQSEELSRINLELYFEGLTSDLRSSLNMSKDIEVNNFHFEIEKIGLKSIVPLALIFNELYSNSLKHAFDDQAYPTIDVSLSKLDDEFFLFTYSDNGTWKEPGEQGTFGSELILSLTDQLEGEVEFSSHPKTMYRFRIKHLEL